MSIFEKHRFKIFNAAQHPYKHVLGDFTYNNPKLPGAITLGDTLDYLISALYPNFIAEVANPAALPGAATIGDYYIVTDDGDGKRAGYVWQMIDGAAQWFKRFDVDWSTESLLASAYDSASATYVHKYGTQDRDGSDALFAGDLAGQRIYGGDTAGEHLILYSNSGDAAGNTGFIQFGDDTRPLVDSTFSSGSNTYRWLGVFTDQLDSGTMTITGGSITDTSGTIDFGNEDLDTTGDISCGGLTATTFGVSTLVFASGSITDTTGAIDFGNENLSTSGNATVGTMLLQNGSITDTTGSISFNDENLVTTGTLGCGALTASQITVDDISINANAISILTADTNLALSANGTGVVNVSSAMSTLGITATGTVSVTGQLNADNLTIDGNTISSANANGDIIINPNGSGFIELGAAIFPTTDSGWDIGKSGNVWNDLWLDGNIQDGTNTFLMSELMALRSINYRDAGRTSPAQAGDAAFFNGTLWLASVPDSEIKHEDLSNLTTTDGGHTQFVMLAGRVGGQTVQGGTDASSFLDLESTAHATKGSIRVKDNFIPFTSAAYTTSWAGTDLGDSTHYFRDLYTKGEAKGLRFENYLKAGIPASSAANVGRAVYITDEANLYVDTGSAFVTIGNINKHIEDLVYNGTDLVKNIDVSANITDARNAIKQLLDNTNDFETMAVKIQATSASNVRITTTIALPAGSYRLVVME